MHVIVIVYMLYSPSRGLDGLDGFTYYRVRRRPILPTQLGKTSSDCELSVIVSSVSELTDTRSSATLVN